MQRITECRPCGLEIKRKVAVIGSRDFPHLDMVEYFVLRLPVDTMVVSGGARGVDTVAQKIAEEQGMAWMVIRPDYQAYPSYSAPKMRNQEIALASDEMHAFWDGFSEGTADAIERMHKLKRPVTIHYADGVTVMESCFA